MPGHDADALKSILSQEILDTQGGLVCATESNRVVDYAVVSRSREARDMFHVFHVSCGVTRLVAVGVESLGRALSKGREVSAQVVPETHCVYCNTLAGEDYMVRDTVWREAELGRGRIHLACLEEQLGRDLLPEDFDLDLPINEGIRFSYEMGLKEGDHLYDILAQISRIQKGMGEGDVGLLAEEAMLDWDQRFGNGRWRA